MQIGMWELLLVLLVVVLLFGSGKISALMGDVAKGIKAFKRGMADDQAPAPPAAPAPPPAQIAAPPPAASPASSGSAPPAAGAPPPGPGRAA
jgi:sec-independent protein translocase protein TatA